MRCAISNPRWQRTGSSATRLCSQCLAACLPSRACPQPEAYAEWGNECLGVQGDPGATDCLEQLKRNLITATAASSLISTFFIGYFANLPLALAPGMGVWMRGGERECAKRR